MLSLLPGLLALMLGAAIGSFLTVVASRLPPLVLEDHGFAATARQAVRTLSWPGSHCDACNHPIGWRDNIPVLSYALLKGRCRNCSAKVSATTWVLEVLAGIAAILCLMRLGWTAEAGLLFALLAFLLALSAIDIAEQLLPDILVAPVAVLGLVHALNHDSMTSALAAAALAGSVLWGIGAVFRLYAGQDGMGLGDVKLAAALGLWLSPEALPLFLVTSFALGLVWQLPALWRGAATGRSAVPFGPFLCASGALYALFAELAPRFYLALAGL